MTENIDQVAEIRSTWDRYPSSPVKSAAAAALAAVLAAVARDDPAALTQPRNQLDGVNAASPSMRAELTITACRLAVATADPAVLAQLVRELAE